MNKEILLNQVNVEMEYYKDDLKLKLEKLQKTIERELKCLSKIEDHLPNSLGVIQMQGQEIDVLCGKIYQLNSTKELLKGLEK